MARPRLGESKKAARVSVCFTLAEHAEVSEKAAASGLTPAEWLRRAGLALRPGRPVPEVNLTLYRELARLAAELRQLPQSVPEGAAQADSSTLWRELQANIVALRLSLVGGAGDDC